MTARPTITTIIPVFNGARYLEGALASVAAQTMLPDEVIVIDDGSTDDSVEVAKSADVPFHLRVERQANAGQSAARNHGSRLASGDLLAFLDQDDAWHPRHLELLSVPLLEDPDVMWAYSDFDEIDSDGHTVTRGFIRDRGVEHPKQTLLSCVAGDLMVLPSSSLLRRDAFDRLGGFDESLQGYEDDDLYVRAFRAGWGMVFDARPLTRFRIHGQSSSANGSFADSRRRFSEKLYTSIEDDERLSRYYFRDLIAPRFFSASLDDYIRAVSVRDWKSADKAVAAVRHFGRLRGDQAAMRWKLALISNPRRFRWLLQLHDALPLRFRVTRNPAIRLR